MLALRGKREVWVYRVQPQGTVPDVWGRRKGVVDSIKSAGRAGRVGLATGEQLSLASGLKLGKELLLGR